MSVLFTPGELFDIAIQIERNGAAFYRKAAAGFTDDAIRAELESLADMEDDHEATFAALKERLTDASDDWFDPDSDAAQYLESFTSGRIFDVSNAGADVGPHPTLEAVLRQAIERERDSVMFYLGMKGFVPASEGTDKIDSIIRQEMGHITILERRLRAIA